MTARVVYLAQGVAGMGRLPPSHLLYLSGPVTSHPPGLPAGPLSHLTER